MEEKIMNDLVEIISAHNRSVQANNKAAALAQRYNIIRKEFKEKYGENAMSSLEILMANVYENVREELKENGRT